MFIINAPNLRTIQENKEIIIIKELNILLTTSIANFQKSRKRRVAKIDFHFHFVFLKTTIKSKSSPDISVVIESISILPSFM